MLCYKIRALFITINDYCCNILTAAAAAAVYWSRSGRRCAAQLAYGNCWPRARPAVECARPPPRRTGNVPLRPPPSGFRPGDVTLSLLRARTVFSRRGRNGFVCVFLFLPPSRRRSRDRLGIVVGGPPTCVTREPDGSLTGSGRRITKPPDPVGGGLGVRIDNVEWSFVFVRDGSRADFSSG